MKKPPTFGDFVFRVGGLLSAYLGAVLLAKAYFPGHEVTAIFVVSAFALVVLIVEAWRKKSK